MRGGGGGGRMEKGEREKDGGERERRGRGGVIAILGSQFHISQLASSILLTRVSRSSSSYEDPLLIEIQ